MAGDDAVATAHREEKLQRYKDAVDAAAAPREG